MCVLQVLYAQDVDERGETYDKALEMGEQYQRRAKYANFMQFSPFNLCFILDSSS